MKIGIMNYNMLSLHLVPLLLYMLLLFYCCTTTNHVVVVDGFVMTTTTTTTARRSLMIQHQKTTITQQEALLSSTVVHNRRISNTAIKLFFGGNNNKNKYNDNDNDNTTTNNNNNNNNNVDEDIEDDDEKFGLQQRIISLKCLILGGIVGSIANAPISLLHALISTTSSSLGQFEYDTDSAVIIGGLFAIVYRYCIRQDINPQLNQGVIGAFIITRTLSKINIPTYCTAIPLYCGKPFGYIDYNIIEQLIWYGIESVFLFSFTALAIDTAIEKGYITKFPG